MRKIKIAVFAVLMSALTVLALAGLGMTDDTQPAATQAAPAMSNLSTAAPMASHSIAPAQQ